MLLYKRTVFVLDIVFCYLILRLKSESYKLPHPRPKRVPEVREDSYRPNYNIYEIRDYRTYILDNVDYYRNASYSNARRSYNRSRFARQQVIDLTTIYRKRNLAFVATTRI